MQGVHCRQLQDRIMAADEAAKLIGPGMTLGFSGFTRAGYPKEVPEAIARLGQATGLTVITGASTGPELDDALAGAGLIARRMPFQTAKALRENINRGATEFVDTHLSHMPGFISTGVTPIDYAIIECSSIREDGSIVGTTSVGCNAAMLKAAKNVILEVNLAYKEGMEGFHDIYDEGGCPGRREIPIYHPSDRCGSPYLTCDLDKVRAIVFSERFDSPVAFSAADENSAKIAGQILELFRREVSAGRMPKNLLPIQSGVGSVANAVLSGLQDSEFEGLTMYTEVVQDSALQLIRSGKITFASCTALSLSPDGQKEFLENLEFYKKHMVFRPQNISNSPEVAHRLGVIALNTAVEFDLTGCVNSTNVLGSRLINGIGGSGDFARSARLVVFSTVSVAKGGAISSVVPMCAHVDHVEHDVHVVVTEQGMADLRCLSAKERAEMIIENCCHPDYRPQLRAYYEQAKKVSYGQNVPLDLENALSWHRRYQLTGSMKEN